jgi:hypothetical protein
MKVTILDDWFDTLRGLPCFVKLDHHDVTVWSDHVQNTDKLAARLAQTECLVLFRERTQITAALLDRFTPVQRRGTSGWIAGQKRNGWSWSGRWQLRLAMMQCREGPWDARRDQHGNGARCARTTWVEHGDNRRTEHPARGTVRVALQRRGPCQL